MTPTIQTVLEQRFSLASFRQGQQEVIETLLAGRSALAVFPTGGGKSLCYQLPALMLDGLTIVVSPLMALMKDQVDRLQSLNIPAARIDSSLKYEELQETYQQLEQGTLKLLYIAPERLSNEGFFSRLTRLRIDLLAVDEAHCISEWGHNFRPDYLKLAQQAKALGAGRVLALTATATPAVVKQICERFDIHDSDYVTTGFFRENLQLKLSPQPISERNKYLSQSLRNAPDEATIVYVTLQRTAEELAEFLKTHQLIAMPYHAGLKDEQRQYVQESFMAGEIQIVVATIAFGMGIDKSDIRAIYHYNLPKSLENYMQEIGRAGRDGSTSHCELLADIDDLTVLENFTYGDTPDTDALSALTTHLLQQEQVFDISNYELSQQFDMRPLVINTLLTYLELEDIIKATAAFYTEYKISFIKTADDITASFNQARGNFLQRLFTSGKPGRIWLTIKPEDASIELNEDRQRIVKALNYLEQENLIKLKVAGIRQGYRITKQLSSEQLTELIERLQQQFQKREQRDIERTQQVCDWVQNSHCHQQALMHYFGETLASPCGECSGCLGQTPTFSPRIKQSINAELIEKVIQENHPALKRPRQLARFLCGLSSPVASRARLSRHPYFAALIHTPFAEVLTACEDIAT